MQNIQEADISGRDHSQFYDTNIEECVTHIKTSKFHG